MGRYAAGWSGKGSNRPAMNVPEGFEHLIQRRWRQQLVPLHPSCANLLSPLLAEQEDDLLRHLIGEYGAKNWSIIANGIKGRSGKSCRLRYAAGCCETAASCPATGRGSANHTATAT